MKQEMCCQYNKAQPAISMQQGDCTDFPSTQLLDPAVHCCILVFQLWAVTEALNPDLGVWKSQGGIADSSLLISLFLCVYSWVPRIMPVLVNMWEQPRAFHLCFWNLNYSFKWLCWEQQRWGLAFCELASGTLSPDGSSCYPLLFCYPRLLFMNSVRPLIPSQILQIPIVVLLSINSSSHSTCCSCFQAAYLVISQPSG